MVTYTHDELVEMGRDVAAEWRPGFEVRGQVATNVQMYAVLLAAVHDKLDRIESFGCCGETERRTSDGVCPHIGICPAVLRALELLKGLTDE